MKLRYTKRALLDLVEIQDYISADNPDAARRVIAEIELEIDRLAEHPALGRTGRIEETRELVILRYPYVVAYREYSGEVQILAIIHSARDWPDSM